MSKKVYLYSDGSCRGNPGPGGYAAVLTYGQNEKEVTGGQENTTNNRMELLAVINGLKAIKRKCTVVIVTDSQYVITVIKTCMGNGKAKANPDLIKELRKQVKRHDIEIKKVLGHSGHTMNERVDYLAHFEATKRLRSKS